MANHSDDDRTAPADEPERERKIPALFATIHFRSPERPDGYTAEEIAELNELANRPSKP